MAIVITTEHGVQVMWDNLTALSRIHSKGTLFVPETAIAVESGYLQRDVHDTLTLAELKGWVVLANAKTLQWRLKDGVVTSLPEIKYCDVCRSISGLEMRALADARVSSGRWGYVCAEHFIAGDCTLGLGRGQFLRLEY